MMKKQHAKLIALVMIVVALALVPVWVKNGYYMDLLILITINSILAMTFVMTYRAGMINVAVQVFWGIGAYASALLVMKAGFSFWAAMPIAAIMAAVVSLALSFLLLRNIGFQFIVLSMVISMLFVVVLGNVEFFGRYAGIQSVPHPNPIRIPGLPVIEFNTKAQYFWLLLVLAVIVVLAFSALYNSSIGRAWRAIGLNSDLAATLGINVFRYRTIAFCIANGTCGLLGAYFAHYQWYIMPDTFEMFKGLYISMYAVLGGVESSFLGPIIGTVIMIAFPEGMRIANEAEPIITGILILFVVTLLPKGVVSIPYLRFFFADPLGTIGRFAGWIRKLLVKSDGGKEA
ncbi:MAG: branched-chain amino acid ABC transporter permease [Clostridiales Family XIII bacterium]|jgi:branched-chain amino acid transport system permease protein|nr:branched-chain amino acid ABC transporter permease [Clostridiales Family XIII bacterium]